MKDTLEYIVESLVKEKTQVGITQTEDNQTIIYYIKVANEDIGRIIGKQGRIIHSLRTIFKTAGLKKSQNVRIEIVEENQERK